VHLKLGHSVYCHSCHIKKDVVDSGKVKRRMIREVE